MPATVHSDDVEVQAADHGPIGGRWRDLGAAAGSVRLGASRVEVPAGRAMTPLHAEDEEIFYVLAGSGSSYQEDGCFAIGTGDVVFYAAERPAHTVIAGEQGIEVLAMGTAWPRHAALRFPRLGAIKSGGLILRGESIHQFALEAALGPIELPPEPDPRPPTIVAESEVEPFRLDMGRSHASGRALGRAAGARDIALNRADVDPGAEAAPPHCHSHEEELFVVLDGDGVLLLGSGEEEHPVRAGSVVARPAGTGVAHAFRAGEQGMSLLMFGDRHPGDMTYYPRSGKVALRGLGITFRPELVPWFDG